MTFVEGSITDLPMETFPGAAGIVPVKDPLASNVAGVARRGERL